jgi:hypothetical protein
MAATYYIWKWADNDLPGRPSDIVARLCAGEMPGALQPFSPKQVFGRLAEVADQRRTEMSELLIEAPGQAAGQASFIHLCDPASDSPWLADRLLRAVWPADLTLYSETNNRLLGLPKRNVVELPAGRQLLDIEPGDIPELLHTLGNQQHLTAFACYDRNGNMFQIWSHRHRYAVEWQVLPGRDFNHHRIWVAGKPVASQRRARLGEPNSRLELFDNEILGMADAQRLWVTFLAGAARPESYLWRDITQELNKPGHPPRHRHQQKEDQPPL